MAFPIIRWDYDALKRIAQIFGRDSQAALQTLQREQRAKDSLQNGDWLARGLPTAIWHAGRE